MYSFIRGNVAYIEDNAIDIDVNGVGYHIFTTKRTVEEAASEMGEMQLYTKFIVKEDEMSLYGFPTRQEKNMFEKLITINGVGPKAAMSILSAMTVQDIATALLSQDTKAFSRVNGIGPKTAGRIVLELKDRVDIADAIGREERAPVTVSGAITPETEAAEALMGLGYSKAEAAAAVAAVSALGDTAEELTLMALKRLAM